MKWLLPVAVFLSLCGSAYAQEFDVFDVSDFVDPHVHGTHFSKDGLEVTDRGELFHVLRAVLGGVSDYTWRSTPSHSNVAFLHLADSVYLGAYQGNVKFTMLQSQHQAILPRYRLALQGARYADMEVKEENEMVHAPGRWLASAAIEENRSCTTTAEEHCSHRFNTEFASQIDASLTIHGRTMAGTAVVVWRDASDLGGRLFRATLFYRWVDKTYWDRVRLNVSFGTGMEQTDGFHAGVTRLGTAVSVDVAHLGTVNIAYTPTYLPAEHGRHLANEVAFFVDRTVYAQLGKRRCVLGRCR